MFEPRMSFSVLRCHSANATSRRSFAPELSLPPPSLPPLDGSDGAFVDGADENSGAEQSLMRWKNARFRFRDMQADQLRMGEIAPLLAVRSVLFVSLNAPLIIPVVVC